MPDKVRREYWDTNPFISLISNLSTQEAINRRSNLKLFFQDAIDGKSQLFTSTVTIVEVVRTEDTGNFPANVPADIRQKITDLFEEPYVILIPLDPSLAAKARDLRWQYPTLTTMDSIQLASAVFARVDVMFTYDARLLSLNGLVGIPPLKIEEPKYTGGQQRPLIPGS